MLRIEGIKLPVGCGEAVLREKVLQRLRLRNAGDLLCAKNVIEELGVFNISTLQVFSGCIALKQMTHH